MIIVNDESCVRKTNADFDSVPKTRSLLLTWDKLLPSESAAVRLVGVPAMVLLVVLLVMLRLHFTFANVAVFFRERCED